MICAFYAREQRADRDCTFMDSNGFCNYAHMDKFRVVDKENTTTKQGAEAKEAWKWPSDGNGKGTGKKIQRKR